MVIVRNLRNLWDVWNAMMILPLALINAFAISLNIRKLEAPISSVVVHQIWPTFTHLAPAQVNENLFIIYIYIYIECAGFGCRTCKDASTCLNCQTNIVGLEADYPCNCNASAYFKMNEVGTGCECMDGYYLSEQKCLSNISIYLYIYIYI